MYRATSLLLAVVLAWPAHGQGRKKAAPPSAKPQPLTIDLIMRGAELTGYPPQAVRWSHDSRRVYFRWKQASDPREKEYDTYVVNRDGGGLTKLSEEEQKDAPPLGGVDNRAHTLTLFVEDGDIYLYDHAAGKRRALVRTVDPESNPRFTQDETRVVFTRANNLFTQSLKDGALTQLTDIRTGPPAPERKGTSSQEYLKKEERELLEAIRERARLREEAEAKKKKQNARKPFYLAARQSVVALQLSPGEEWVLASIADAPEGAKTSVVPNYVTESSYTEDIQSRAKVGDTQRRSRLAMLAVETGEVKWVDHGQKEKAADGKEQERAVRMRLPEWSEDGKHAVIDAMAADFKDRWLLALDPATAKTRVLVAMHDDAWIGGPGDDVLGWLKDNETIYYQSERDGWSHLYRVPFAGGEPKQLTSGKWEVRGAQLLRDKPQFLLTTSEANAGENHVYLMSIDGGDREKITTLAGNHQVTPSPDGTQLAAVYSYVNVPPELYIEELQPQGKTTQVTKSPSPQFASYRWMDAPIVQIPARDGVKAQARLYKPSNFRRGGPAVIFVHGAGYLQNAHRWWSFYSREYMFHHLLMANGYLVLDLDYRGSAGYGRDWRTAIYRHMGGKDLDDQVDAVKWLAATHGVDAKKIGIYGGSYGGFITLMAMFTQPDVFRAGGALRPVTDWAHYNHTYTSQILNMPQQDAEAYKRSSPIYFASGLKGALLIAHGMVDVNVHFQDTVRLVQRLIELRKENWELAVYPVEDHAFAQPTSWADEYKRIFKLFEKNLK